MAGGAQSFSRHASRDGRGCSSGGMALGGALREANSAHAAGECCWSCGRVGPGAMPALLRKYVGRTPSGPHGCREDCFLWKTVLSGFYCLSGWPKPRRCHASSCPSGRRSRRSRSSVRQRCGGPPSPGARPRPRAPSSSRSSAAFSAAGRLRVLWSGNGQMGQSRAQDYVEIVQALLPDLLAVFNPAHHFCDAREGTPRATPWGCASLSGSASCTASRRSHGRASLRQLL